MLATVTDRLWINMGARSEQPNGSGLPCGGFGLELLATFFMSTHGKTSIKQAMCLISHALDLGRRPQFPWNCACLEAATAGGKAVYVNRKQFDGESNLMCRIESNRPAEGERAITGSWYRSDRRSVVRCSAWSCCLVGPCRPAYFRQSYMHVKSYRGLTARKSFTNALTFGSISLAIMSLRLSLPTIPTEDVSHVAAKNVYWGRLTNDTCWVS